MFVDALYRSVLGRTPGAGDRAYWVDRLDGGTSPSAVGTAVATSAEARRHLVALGDHSALDRGPGPGETYWVGRLASGLTPESLILQLLTSPEGRAVWDDTASGLAEGAYRVYLNRASDPTGLAYWSDRLESQTTTAGIRSVLISFGRTQAATNTAVAGALETSCGVVPTLEPSERAALEAVWAQTGRNPLRLRAAAVVVVCPEGPVVG